MKRILITRFFVAMTASLMLIGCTSVLAQRPSLERKAIVHRRTTAAARPPVRPVEPIYTVESGTVIRARMNQSLNSKTTPVGAAVHATVTEPVYSSNGVVVIPVGSILNGRVNLVRPAAKGGTPGQIDTSFSSVRLPNGRVRTINGSLTDLTSGKTTSDNEGGVGPRKMEHRKIVFIGGGTAGGALLGAIAGGGKATAIGALLGAGAGFLGEKYMKGPEAEVRSGTEFSVFLNQSIALPRFGEAGVNP